jgi:hypothetical protein
MVERISRRSALMGAIATFALAGCAPTTQLAGPVPISAVQVDVRPLRDSGAVDVADWVAHVLPGELHNAVAAHWAAKGGATLHAQIAVVSLNMGYAPGAFSMGVLDMATGMDSIEGDVWLTDPHGYEIARTHILATRPAGFYGGDYDWVGNLRLRVELVAGNFAYWTPRQLGL